MERDCDQGKDFEMSDENRLQPLKVFLAEDEFVMREGIRRSIDWEAHGYEFCGDARDGEEALTRIRELMPDILITDIRMPFMDGLELSRLVKKEFPDTEILLLTGYEEFDFAVRAIRIGVSQYLTKPINGDQLLSAVDTVAAEIRKRQEKKRQKAANELLNSFEEVSQAFAHQFISEVNQLMSVEKTQPLKEKPREKFDMDQVDPKQFDRKIIQEFLRNGSRDQVQTFVQEFFEELGKDVTDSNIFRQYILMDAYFCVVDFLDGIGVDKGEIEPLDTTSDIMMKRDSCISYLTRIIGRAVDLRELFFSDRNKDTVKKVLEYIEQNYADEELSLNSLASYVGFSPNHLSMIFGQVMGVTFSKYLTDLRMNKAKELLRTTDKRSSDISMEVGYKDPHYFSFLFKKTQGMTPTQYRQSRS